MRSFAKYGAAIPITLAVVTTVGGLAALTYNSHSTYIKANFFEATIPTALELELLIRISGVSPEGLAAAGVSAQSTTAVVTRGSNYIVPNFDAISDAQREHANAKRDHGALVKFVRSGQADETQIAQLDRARARLDTAAAAEQTWLNAVYNECVVGLTTNQQASLSAITSNSDWDAPIQFRAATRSQEDWVRLRKALANVRIADKLGEVPDPRASQLVAEANANANVSAARSGLNNLPFIQVQWDAAINR